MELIKRYQEQYTEFCKIDDFNLEERAKRVPAEKHFWVCRLIDAKIERGRLQKQRNTLNGTLSQKIRETSPVALNEREFNNAVNNSPTLETLNEKINENAMMIEYLELLVKQVTFIAQDIKNIIMVKQLEEN